MRFLQRFTILGLLIVALLFTTVQTTSAEETWESTWKVLQTIQGDWYDGSGNKILSIRDKYINDCEVVAGSGWAGSISMGQISFRIQESSGTRNILIGWQISGEGNDSITLNNLQTLHRKNQSFYESIGGIYLGMPESAVKEKLGEPYRILAQDYTLQMNGKEYNLGWYYKDQQIIVDCRAGSVCQVTMLKDSPLKLDKSGLTCKSLMSEFQKEYSMKTAPRWPSADFTGAYSIGYGEYIFFGKNMIDLTLSLYNN